MTTAYVDMRAAEILTELRAEHDKATATVAEAAGLLGCSAATVRRSVWSGEIPAHRLGGVRGPLRIRLADLARFIAESERKAIPLAPRPVRGRAARSAAEAGA